jgi:hypothetical protein
VTFAVDGWGRNPHYVLIAGVDQKPAAVAIAGVGPGRTSQQPAGQGQAHFNPQQRLLAITLDRPCEIHVPF